MQMVAFSVTVYTSGANWVQRKLVYEEVNGLKRWRSSPMLNFQGQRKLTPAFQPIRKMPQGHREPTHCSVTAMYGHVRWPVYTSLIYLRHNLHWNTLVALSSRWTSASANGGKKYKASSRQSPTKLTYHWSKRLSINLHDDESKTLA